MNTVKLYFPSVDKNNNPIESGLSNQVYEQLCKDICSVSGGLTITPCQGYYLNSTGKLIQDDISLISVYTESLDQMIKIIRTNAELILKCLNQESVLIEINN